MRLLFFLIFCFFTTAAFAQVDKTIKADSSKLFVLGVTTLIHSNILAEQRTINIYLPEGYNAADTVKYPVVYLLDGSADEDFIHIVGLYQFNNFSWIGRVPKSIIVGIANVDRRRDFTFESTAASDKKLAPTSGKSAKFISFIEKELQPFIEKNYKTSASKTIIGQSLGGLLAVEILATKPTLFNKYIIISPSLWWNNGSLLQAKITVPQNIAIYIGCGKEGLGLSETPHVMEVDANVLADNLKKANTNAPIYFDYLPQEDHATIIHQAVFNALRLLFPDAEK